jgi:hypothetical protein
MNQFCNFAVVNKDYYVLPALKELIQLFKSPKVCPTFGLFFWSVPITNHSSTPNK